MEVLRAWCIDFCFDGRIVPAKDLEVCEYEAYELWREMKVENVKRVEDLTDWDRVVFATEAAADLFLSDYRTVFAEITKAPFKYCTSRDLPALPYRKRNLVQTLLGAKLQTYRDYLRTDLIPGELFNLHDRTNFVTVKLKRIVQVDRQQWRYDFELVNKPAVAKRSPQHERSLCG